jgi:hypothetical protein
MIDDFLPQIRVKIKLLTAARGGRAEPIPAGEYRGILSARGQHFSFRSNIAAGGWALGDTTTLDIEFLFPQLALPFLKERQEFNLWESGTVGYGRVVTILPTAKAVLSMDPAAPKK